MGRRKIEIQPIRHERNRSVTFLKRKNGLFKKAYELGVLCSVDIAVIVFEERQGHHTKVYEYGSRNVSEIVQRHLKFDGDKDARGPSDFSGGNPTIAANDDEDDEDDDAPAPTNPRKRQRTTGPPIAPTPVNTSDTRTPSNDTAPSRAPSGNNFASDNVPSSLPHSGPSSNVDFLPPQTYRQQGPPLTLSGSMYSAPSMSNMPSTLSSLPISSDRHLPPPGFGQPNTSSHQNARAGTFNDNSNATSSHRMDPPNTGSRPGTAAIDTGSGYIVRPGSGASTGSGGADFGSGYPRSYGSLPGYASLPGGIGTGGRYNYGGPGPGPGGRSSPASAGGMGGPPGMPNVGGGGAGGHDRTMEWPMHGGGPPGGGGGGGGGGGPGGPGGNVGSGPPTSASMNWLAFLGSGMNAKQDGHPRP